METLTEKKSKDRGPSGPVVEAAINMQQSITKRFVEFLDFKGPSVVARAVGISPQKFYNFRSGVNPNMDTLLQVAAAYPDEFDIIYVVTGRKLLATGEIITPVIEPTEPPKEYVEAVVKNLEKEIDEKYKRLLDEKDAQINEARKDKDRMWELINALKKLEGFSLPPLTNYRNEFGIG